MAYCYRQNEQPVYKVLTVLGVVLGIVGVYVNRVLINVIIGTEEQVQEDIDKATELGYDESLLESQIEAVRARR